MVLSKKATNKDESLKMQMMLSLKNHKGDPSQLKKYGSLTVFLAIRELIQQ